MRINNYKGYLLAKLAEECVEVSHAVHKVLCFGPGKANWEKLEGEIKDVLGTIECLHHNDVMDVRELYDEAYFIRKQNKIRRCWRDSLRNDMGWEGSPDDIFIPDRSDSRQLSFDF